MKIESTFEYRAVFDTAEEAMEHGSKIHEALLGDPYYINNTVILNCTEEPEVVKVTVFLDDFHYNGFRGDTEARDKLINKIKEAIDNE